MNESLVNRFINPISLNKNMFVKAEISVVTDLTVCQPEKLE